LLQNRKIEMLEEIKSNIENKLQSVSSDLQEQVSGLAAKNATLEEEFTKAQERSDQVSCDLQRQVHDLSAMNASLQEELTKTQENEKLSTRSNEQLHSEIANKETKLSELNEVISALEKEKRQLEVLLQDQVCTSFS
jgi:predicted  nucleic acid-binding Zn-ribbon protein